MDAKSTVRAGVAVTLSLSKGQATEAISTTRHCERHALRVTEAITPLLSLHAMRYYCAR